MTSPMKFSQNKYHIQKKEAFERRKKFLLPSVLLLQIGVMFPRSLCTNKFWMEMQSFSYP